MFVYSRDFLEKRIALTPSVGFFVDYWFLLHGDQTPSILARRPISTSDISEIIESNLDQRTDNALIRAVRREFHRLICFRLSSRNELPSAEASFDDWAMYLQSINRFSLFSRKIADLANAIKFDDFVSIASISDLLSSEFYKELGSSRMTFQRCKNLLLNGRFSGDAVDFLHELFEWSVLENYKVTFAVTPSELNNTREESLIEHHMPQIEFTDWSEISLPNTGRKSGRAITSINHVVAGFSPEDALNKSTILVRDDLETLRAERGLIINLHNAVYIEKIDRQENTWLSYPSPFWKHSETQIRSKPIKKFSSTRKFFDKNWDFNDIDSGDLVICTDSARPHYASALNRWAIDVHFACMDIWQTLESTIPSIKLRNDTAGVNFIRVANDLFARDFSNFSASYYNTQAGSVKRSLERANWSIISYNDHSSRAVSLGNMLSHSNPFLFSGVSPPYFEIFIEGRVGLLSQSRDQATKIGALEWIETRLKVDLEFLYSIRNSIAHRGYRRLSIPFAQHVGRTGLELFFFLSMIEDPKKH